ncbi:MAG: hypothetical protein U0Q20_07860 [Mycobacterium sp.]|nr:hypothetical protein [Mycobacterium sp.]
MADDEVDVFDERESLSRIRDYARMRLVSPIAVLFGVILRALTGAPIHVMIPPMVGSPKPLNLVVVTVGPSGLGKTASDDVAEQYWPADIPVYPLGTAEGTVQAFDPDDDGNPQVPNIIFSSSEIDNWAALGERAGSMTFPVLRQLVTGDTVGMKNASKAHTRVLNKRSYGAGVSLSAQPGSKGAAVLFADAPGGFPQRCLFGTATDPQAPDDPPTGIEPYKPAEVPDFTPNAGQYYEIPFPDSVITEIRQQRRNELRGVTGTDPLDGHRNLTRCKVAAGLMILEGHAAVTEDDWRIAGRILAVSDQTRGQLMAATEHAARAANRARAHALADRDEIVGDRKVLRAKQAILRWLGKCGPQLAARDLLPKLKADIRADFGAAAAELAAEGLIHEISVKNGVHYRLAAQGTAVPVVQRPNEQFNDAVPAVQRCTAAAVTDLDSRRSAEHRQPALSCPKWLEHHIDALLAEGCTAINSFAVIQAGQVEGHSAESIRQAASRNPRIESVPTKGDAVSDRIWLLSPRDEDPQQALDLDAGEAS